MKDSFKKRILIPLIVCPKSPSKICRKYNREKQGDFFFCLRSMMHTIQMRLYSVSVILRFLELLLLLCCKIFSVNLLTIHILYREVLFMHVSIFEEMYEKSNIPRKSDSN